MIAILSPARIRLPCQAESEPGTVTVKYITDSDIQLEYAMARHGHDDPCDTDGQAETRPGTGPTAQGLVEP